MEKNSEDLEKDEAKKFLEVVPRGPQATLPSLPSNFLELTEDRFSYSSTLATQGRHKGAEENVYTLWIAQVQERVSRAELSMLRIILLPSNHSD